MTKRILFYINALAGGGAERVWALVASALREAGEEVLFAVDREASENLPYLHPAIPLHVLGQNHVSATMALSRLIAKEKPDAAFATLGASDLKLLAAAKWAGTGTKVVLAVQGDYTYEDGMLGRLRFRLTPWTARLADATIVVSEGLKAELTNKWGVADRLLTCVNNPVYLPRMDAVPSSQELAARDDFVLSVGRLVRQKDHATLIRAFAASTKAKRLMIAGDGPMREELQALAKELNVESRVDFLGYLAEPWPAFSRAKLYAHASWGEAFGNVIAEAMGFGLPVVTTRSAGPVEILDHGVYGDLLEPGDVAGMTAAMDKVLTNPGDPAYRRARAEQYGVARIAKRYLDLAGLAPQTGIGAPAAA